MKTETVYAWLTGQDDNVGDSSLRRGYADALRARGPLVAYVADASTSYVGGLGLAESDRVARRFLPWLSEAVWRSRGAPVTIALNAGEFSFSGRYTLTAVPLVLALGVFRRLGGRVVWLGASVPQTARGRTWLFRRLHRRAQLVSWRDRQTSLVFAPAPWMPDWVLGLEPSDEGRLDRVSLGLSLRADRNYPSEEWLQSVRDTAQRLGLQIVTVAQVERDSAVARQLAADLGGRALVFDGRNLREQERAARAEYARMRVLLSDRLHALLLAAAEGAVPLGWCEAATTKITRHFEALGMPWVTITPGQEVSALAALDMPALDDMAAQGRKRVAAARALIARVAADLASDQWTGDATASK